MQELPVWFQDHYSGDWWGEATGLIPVTQEEYDAWEADQALPPPTAAEEAQVTTVSTVSATNTVY